MFGSMDYRRNVNIHVLDWQCEGGKGRGVLMFINQYWRSWVGFIPTAKIGRNIYFMSYCDRFSLATCNIFGFLGFSISYIKIPPLEQVKHFR